MTWKVTEKLSKVECDIFEREFMKPNPKLINVLVNDKARADVEHIKTLLRNGGISKQEYSRKLLIIMKNAGYDWIE